MTGLIAQEVNSNAPSGQLSLTSGSQELYRWSNPNDEDEAFYIEAIQKSGQYVTLPDEGLAIYRVDPTNGDRDDEWHPQVQLEHADGNRDPENMTNPANFNVKIQSYVNYGYYGFWQTVASGNGSISYSAEPGYYQIVVSSNWGSGAYTLIVSE